MPEPDFDKPKETLIAEIVSYQAGSTSAAQNQALIDLKNTQMIEAALNDLRDATVQNAQSSDALAKRVYGLNLVIAIATAIGTLVAIATFLTRNEVPQRAGDLQQSRVPTTEVAPP